MVAAFLPITLIKPSSQYATCTHGHAAMFVTTHWNTRIDLDPTLTLLCIVFTRLVTKFWQNLTDCKLDTMQRKALRYCSIQRIQAWLHASIVYTCTHTFSLFSPRGTILERTSAANVIVSFMVDTLGVSPFSSCCNKTRNLCVCVWGGVRG